MSHFRQDFIRFDIEHEVLHFGKLKTKAGRTALLTKVFSSSQERPLA